VWCVARTLRGTCNRAEERVDSARTALAARNQGEALKGEALKALEQGEGAATAPTVAAALSEAQEARREAEHPPHCPVGAASEAGAAEAHDLPPVQP